MNREHIRTLCWLRWRLTMNQWRRSGSINAVLAAVGTVVALSLAVAGGVFGVVAGALLFSRLDATGMRWLWDVWAMVFLFTWLIGVLNELQRSESLDLTRMLHLPISLRDVFVLNYIAAHLNFTVIATVPAAVGLIAGFTLSKGPMMLLLLPCLVAFVFMITAWTYCIQGWLAAFVANPRRRRAIAVAGVMILVLALQLPNLVVNVWLRPKGREGRTRTVPLSRAHAAIDQVHRWIPFLWLPQGSKALTEGRVLPALAWTSGLAVLGAIGLGRAYQSARRFHTGVATSKRRSRRASESARRDVPSAPTWTEGRVREAGRPRCMTEWRLPGIPNGAAALALASFRSLSRAPEVKMALGMGIIVPLLVGFGYLLQRDSIPAPLQAVMPAIVVSISLFTLVQLLFNQFGFDRDGFRALVLMPTPRSEIVLGRNLAFLPFMMIVFVAIAAGVVFLLRPGFLWLLEALLLLVSGFLIVAQFGTIASLLIPYRVAPGTMKPTRATLLTQLGMVLSALIFPTLLTPLFLPGAAGILADRFGWAPGVPVSLLGALLLAAVLFEVYRRTLPFMGRLLAQRERAILDVLTSEIE